MKFLSLPCRIKFEKICELLDFFIAGEHKNKQLLFFLLIGNFSNKHKSFTLIRGDSSAGKNHLVSNVLRLIPEKDVFTFVSATDRALNYAEEQLRNKNIIYLKEMTEQSRDFMTEYIKRIVDGGGSHLETVREADGQGHVVQEAQQEAMGIITTLSFEEVQIDLVNRGWVLIPDQTHEQTKAVIDFTFKKQKGKIDRKTKEREVKNQCFLIAESVKSLDFDFEVYISFIDKLRSIFPEKYINVRRDVSKLIHLIEIITLWNQFNRKSVQIGETRYLFSEFTDLELALDISFELFINLVLHIDATKREIIDLFDTSVVFDKDSKKRKVIKQKSLDEVLLGSSEEEEEEEPITFTITEIHQELCKKIGISRRTVQRRMNDLFYEGYLLREKVKGAFVFSKLKDYNILDQLNLPELKTEIEDLVELQYNFYKDMDEDLLEGVYELKQQYD